MQPHALSSRQQKPHILRHEALPPDYPLACILKLNLSKDLHPRTSAACTPQGPLPLYERLHG